MTARIRVVRWGRLPYAAAHSRMEALLEQRVADEVGDTLVLCEHDPVFTLGRARGAAANVLDPAGAPVVQVERGGDVTFHGPGQVVGYPIVRLPDHRRDLHAWLHGLEDVLIGTVARFGVQGYRDPRNTGVWVEGKKIAAIGIAVRRWVSWHGFAINVHTDLGWFQRANPCGQSSDLVTRLVDHVEPGPRLEAVQDAAAAEFRAWWRAWASP